MKKPVGQMKNGLPGPGQDKDTGTTVQKVSEWQSSNLKRDASSTLFSLDTIYLREGDVATCVFFQLLVSQGAQSKGGRVKSGSARNTSKLSRYV